MKIIRSILSLFLAALVLVASSSFYMATHSCGGRVNKVAFLEKADGCGHKSMPPCHRQMMKGCCEDEIISHDAQELKSEANINLTSLLPTFELAPLACVLAEIIPSFGQSRTTFLKYDIPIRSVDRTVTHQVFLI
jgi:hypothetical protein